MYWKSIRYSRKSSHQASRPKVSQYCRVCLARGGNDAQRELKTHVVNDTLCYFTTEWTGHIHFGFLDSWLKQQGISVMMIMIALHKKWHSCTFSNLHLQLSTKKYSMVMLSSKTIKIFNGLFKIIHIFNVLYRKLKFHSSQVPYRIGSSDSFSCVASTPFVVSWIYALFVASEFPYHH